MAEMKFSTHLFHIMDTLTWRRDSFYTTDEAKSIQDRLIKAIEQYEVEMKAYEKKSWAEYCASKKASR